MASNNINYALAGPGNSKAPLYGVSGPGNALQEDEGISISDLLKDRNVQQFMAQLGAKIGGESTGGAISQAGSNLIQRQALAEALAKNSNVTLGADGSMKIQNQTGSGGQSQTQKETTTEQDETSGYDLPSLDYLADSIIGE